MWMSYLFQDGRQDIIVSDDGQDFYMLNQGNGPDNLANFIEFPFSGDDGDQPAFVKFRGQFYAFLDLLNGAARRKTPGADADHVGAVRGVEAPLRIWESENLRNVWPEVGLVARWWTLRKGEHHHG